MNLKIRLKRLCYRLMGNQLKDNLSRKLFKSIGYINENKLNTFKDYKHNL